jgi:hypothetical protein
MCDIFGEAKRRLAREIDSHSAPPSKSIAARSLGRQQPSSKIYPPRRN